MGILDDAIREHLELIRRRGATDSEVQRLEDEAFGPPTRPDEADFPDSEGSLASGNGVAYEEPAHEDAAAHEDVTTLLPAEERDVSAAETAGTGLEEPTGTHVTGDVDEPEDEPVPGTPLEEDPHEEPVADEHAIVEEPPVEAAYDAPEDAGAPAGEEAPSLYDQDQEDMDLDPAPEEQAAEEGPSEEHLAAEPEGTAPLEPPIESLDTVEHAFSEEVVEEHDEVVPSDENAVHEEEPAEPEDEHEADGSDESDEDVLADTPDFLKDQPEDDELWFEQREPKDFDF
jgi:hypothetical protein